MANSQKHEDIKREVSLLMSDLIAKLIQETVDADQAVTTDYLQEIKDYAFDDPDSEHPKLKTVNFEMTDDQGRRQQVTIPVLSLLPLPVLHISEATFDIDTQVTYVEEIVDPDKALEKLKLRAIKKQPNFSKLPPDKEKVILERLKGQVALTEDGKARIGRIVLAAPGTAKTVPNDPTAGASQAPSAGPAADDSNTVRQTFNARIHVKLEQSVLPSGMRGLLQETDRTITTEYI